MKAVVAAFNQEKALVGAFSVITNLRMELFQALIVTRHQVTASSADHLALGRDEAVAAGHRHRVRGGAAHLLPRAAVIIGEADTVRVM